MARPGGAAAFFISGSHKIMYGLLLHRSFRAIRAPEDVDQPIQILTVTRLMQSCRRKWGGTRWEMSKPG
ncbi:MAG: hypothetical protein ABSF52_16780 [Syntrophobacteraceae bacterium]